MSERGTSNARWAILAAGLLLAASAEAGMYRYEDETGVVHYTNAPSDPRYRALLGWIDSRPQLARALSARFLAPFVEAIRTSAERYGVDSRLVEAVITVESRGNPRAVSPKGARGLMQLMPERAAELGVRDSFDPAQNVDGGVRHLRDLLQRFAGDVTLALAAYNAGEEAVRAYRGIPPYRETQDYVRRVRGLYDGGIVSGSTPAIRSVPERIYQQVSDEGTVLFTNVPPNPGGLLKPRF